LSFKSFKHNAGKIYSADWNYKSCNTIENHVMNINFKNLNNFNNFGQNYKNYMI